MNKWIVDEAPQDLRVLTSGFQSWSEAELRPLTDVQPRPGQGWRVEQGHDPGFPPSGEAGVWRSHTVLALVRADGSGWVGSVGDATRTFAQWEARAGTEGVTVTCTLEGPDVPVTWEETGDVIATLETRAAELGAAMGARTPAPVRVWCSWYSYYREVTLEAMLENARLAREHRLDFDVFQLDDGFQTFLGDWEDPSTHFGGHARELPARLAELGLTAGLWLAPFLVQPQSRLFRDHPEWLLRGEDGQPLAFGNNWGGPYHALDTTHPGALAWIRELGRTVRGWGYTYLKIDFLYGATQPGVRHDPSVGRAEAYRMGLQAFRDGVGEDAFILACGAPLAQSIGLVDAMRTGPDVAPLWDEESRRVWLGDATGPSARNALHTALSRWYQHAWYQPDPDVAICRRELSLLSATEREAIAGMLDVIGGLRASSDPISLLDEEGRALLRQCLTVSTPDRPVTLAASHGDAVTHFTRGTFNLTDRAGDGIPAHGYRPGTGKEQV
ncbi:glycoside hydrolase family 36 protein [Deinococcus soli (ex Cha et al. 2016)]|uniref:Glycoside hydrolase n=1 Tax=Deinococcus soli (ex Cha et al. 2016) TaxID=1309411 RepID=A0A0F7JM23_9DEIO|nr:glycoside hydrolase family 36 protein [Deinococcus soli (ex Cha et al. 2016)]AKH15933.1 glycoside hydrolase [Deinococcus soli (ex Cha et al. 2016)]